LPGKSGPILDAAGCHPAGGSLSDLRGLFDRHHWLSDPNSPFSVTEQEMARFLAREKLDQLNINKVGSE
jgi:hypothetical protein